MKILFLDNDGVICLANNWGSRYRKSRNYMMEHGVSDYDPSMLNETRRPVEVRFDNFDKKAVEVLNQILRETDAEIVVSSDWRYHATLEELGEYYTSQGIIKKPIGVTKSLGECEIQSDFEFSKGYGLEQERTIEIKQFLFDNPQITHWVAVDDLNMGKQSSYSIPTVNREWGLENFVHTPKSREGIKQSGIKEKILKFLVS